MSESLASDEQPEIQERDFAQTDSEVQLRPHVKGTSFVTPPQAYHPVSSTRHDDHISRLFIGAHLVVNPQATYDKAHGSFHNLAKRRRVAAKVWRHALRTGSEGKKAELDSVEWRGGSFLVGADVRAAFAEAVEIERRQKEAKKTSSEALRAAEQTKGPSDVLTATSPDDMLKLLSPSKRDSGTSCDESSSSPLLSPVKDLQLNPDAQPDLGHEFACQSPICADESVRLKSEKSARFHDEPAAAEPEVVLAESEAAPTEANLARQESFEKLKQAPDSSAKEAAFRSDRMLLKQGWSPRQALPHPFDAFHQRQNPVAYKEWEEHLVEYKRQRLEIWGRSHGVGPHRVQGRLKLRHVISLQKGKVNLSIYNHSEAAFCITIPYAMLTATAARRRLNKHAITDHYKADGTAVFLFRPLTPSLLGDWVFELWEELGGEIPSTLTVNIPELRARLVIPIPENASQARPEWRAPHKEGHLTGEGYKLLTPAKVVQNCIALVDQVGDWQHLHAERGGDDLELLLAWRRNDILDWVLEDRSVDGARRDCALLAGFAHQQCRRAQAGGLELRTAAHYPDATKATNGQKLPEPPSIEGYVTRAVGLRRERLYLSSQSGHLFVSEAKNAFPPEPPIPPEAVQGVSLKDRLAVLGSSYEQLLHPDAEGALRDTFGKKVKRMFGQDTESLPEVNPEALATDNLSELRQEVMRRFVEYERRRVCRLSESARGYCDLRNIKEVRHVASSKDDEDSDDDVVGEGSKSSRSFEMELHNGKVIHFITQSEVDVQEWVKRLQALALYWGARQRADAIERTAAEPQTALRGRAPFRNQAIGDAPPQDPYAFDADPLAYSRLFDFCSIRGCRGILRFGRLFVTKGDHHRSKERWFALVRGQLISFKIDHHHPISGASIPVDFHERSSSYPLKGCYLITGHVCVSSHRGAERSVFGGMREGRLYNDDLISSSEENECVFELWYGSDPKIGSKGSTAHFRARSQLERDAWAACIGRELERLHREDTTN